jgi:hypothetical protein
VIFFCFPLARHFPMPLLCTMALSHFGKQTSRLFSLASGSPRALVAATSRCQCLVTSRIALQRRSVSDTHDGQQKVRERNLILQSRGNGADEDANFSCFPRTWRRLMSPSITFCRRFVSTAVPADKGAESSINRRKNARNILST